MLSMANQPLLITTAKIGDQLVSDTDLGEEKAQFARFSFGHTEKNVINAFKKGGSGSFTSSEFERMVETGLKNGKLIRKALKV